MPRQSCAGPGVRLDYQEYGDPRGSVVVLSHHGGLVSASDVAPLAAVAADLGIRLISFARPEDRRIDVDPRGDAQRTEPPTPEPIWPVSLGLGASRSATRRDGRLRAPRQTRVVHNGRVHMVAGAGHFLAWHHCRDVLRLPCKG